MKLSNKIRLLIVTGFGVGMLPAAPGTYASAAATGVGFGLLRLCDHPAPVIACGLLGAVAFVFSVKLAPWAEARFGAKDPGRHVIDEVAGQFLTLAIVLAVYPGYHFWAPLLSFVLFRFFDIAKPYPVRSLEKLKGGWGVSLDDALAAVYAGAAALLVLGFAG